MTQIHVVIRRINPALKIDLVQVGRIEDGQFVSIPFDAIADSSIASYLKSSCISDSLYVNHPEVSSLISACSAFPDFSIEFFDNTIVLMFNFDLNCDESTTKEERKRD
nr:MAG TPA: hypothetical protein [Microviridae sp.]